MEHHTFSELGTAHSTVSQRPGIGLFSSKPLVRNGRLALKAEYLRTLRHQHCLSQEEVADECCKRGIHLSVASVKRAEAGHAVLFRTARQLARFFDVPVLSLCP